MERNLRLIRSNATKGDVEIVIDGSRKPPGRVALKKEARSAFPFGQSSVGRACKNIHFYPQLLLNICTGVCTHY